MFKPIKSALEKEGFHRKILHKEPVPFPGSGNQKRYQKILRELIFSEKKEMTAPSQIFLAVEQRIVRFQFPESQQTLSDKFVLFNSRS